MPNYRTNMQYYQLLVPTSEQNSWNIQMKVHSFLSKTCRTILKVFNDFTMKTDDVANSKKKFTPGFKRMKLANC